MRVYSSGCLLIRQFHHFLLHLPGNACFVDFTDGILCSQQFDYSIRCTITLFSAKFHKAHDLRQRLGVTMFQADRSPNSYTNIERSHTKLIKYNTI